MSSDPLAGGRPPAAAGEAKRRKSLEDFADLVIVTPASEVARHRIARRLGVERVDLLVEGGPIEASAADLSEVLRGRASGADTPSQAAERTIVRALALRAAERGANGVVSVRLTSQAEAGGRTRILLAGTLVVLAPA